LDSSAPPQPQGPNNLPCHRKLEELEQEIRKLRSSIATAPDSYANSHSIDGMDVSINDFPVSHGTAVLSPETSVMSNELPSAVPAIPFAEKPEFLKRTTNSTQSSTSSQSIDDITLDASQIDACFRLYVLNNATGGSRELLIVTDFSRDIIHISHFSILISHPKTTIANPLSCFG
jgi:hypothetical protein